MGLLLNLSNSHLFWQGQEPEPIEPVHRPGFLAFPQDPGESIQDAHQRLAKLVAEAEGSDTNQPGSAADLAKVQAVGDPVSYSSFWDHGATRNVIPVTAKRSYWVPEISDRLFFDHGFWTCEHDIPYMERALADLTAEKDWWLFDTGGQKAKLNVLTYDIETTQYGNRRDPPVDMIGYSNFEVEYEASRDLDTEKFDFRFHDLPTDWAEREVVQVISRNLDEEIDHLEQFTKHAVQHDIIAGHNVLGFDNKQIQDRITGFLKQDQTQQNLSPGTREWFQRFSEVWSRRDRSFHFGTQSDIQVWQPVTLDTFHAARKFYFFHDDFTLKGLAPWLGVEVGERVYMEAEEMGIQDAAMLRKTLKYNKHDVQEQIGITQILLAQALPLAFTVNLPMEELLTGGNTKMWDHMAFVRARRQRKIMPATCRAQGVARTIQRVLPNDPFPDREVVSKAALLIEPEERSKGHNKEFVRVAKQGPEMPFWCEHPNVIVRPGGGTGSEAHGYAIPGGLTLKPDSDLQSHFIPWFHVVEADVGAMYPTILKARNLTADAVKPARRDRGEEPDDWIWLFRLDDGFAASSKYHVRRPNDDEQSLTKGRGYMIGVKHNPQPGMVNLAMTGILDTIQKVKDELAEAKASNAPKDRVRVLQMTYNSLKAARNAGTHGILVAVNVSCRQFNVWGGANITTIGQEILHETREDFDERGIRVVYGDTDGIYLGCSKSAGNLPHFAAALDADVEPESDKWITLPDDAIQAVQDANRRWRDRLQYEGFELEAEQYDCMVYIVHKNYLKFKVKNGHLDMETKGNNFRGSDKAPIAQLLLKDAMAQALKEVASWDDEEDARERMKTAIKRATKDVLSTFKVSNTPWEQLVLKQSVKPVKSYKPNPDGSLRTQAVRTLALEQLLEESITAGRKFRFVVCKNPLPLYRDTRLQDTLRTQLAGQGHTLGPFKPPSKSGIKPIEHMWPVEKVHGDHDERHGGVDWVWYKEVFENYVKGAFGFDSLELAVQRDLSSWF